MDGYEGGHLYLSDCHSKRDISSALAHGDSDFVIFQAVHTCRMLGIDQERAVTNLKKDMNSMKGGKLFSQKHRLAWRERMKVKYLIQIIRIEINIQ